MATYTVVSGDTLYRVGLKFGIPWTSLATWNNIPSPYYLTVGQVLQLQAPVAPVPTPTPTPTPGLDKFGVKQLRPTRSDGLTWFSNWSQARTWGFAKDPLDPWFDCAHGNATYKAGNGELVISGSTPRMYVRDPNMQRQWRDVEVTVYFKRVADAGTAWGGLVACTRANHLVDSRFNDTFSYNARMRYDGKIDFEQEVGHPKSIVKNSKTYWSGGLPKGVWLGYKFLVWDEGNLTRMELWLDKDESNNWVKINEMTDNGSWSGKWLNNTGVRAGSESGKPNISVYFRSDDVAANGLVYKKASIREI